MRARSACLTTSQTKLFFLLSLNLFLLSFVWLVHGFSVELRTLSQYSSIFFNCLSVCLLLYSVKRLLVLEKVLRE